MTGFIQGRRDVILSLLAISAANALNACTVQKDNDDGNLSTSGSLAFASDGEFLTAQEMGLVSALVQTIIPKTDTVGAVEVGVPGVLQSLLSDWGDDNMRRYWRAGLAALDMELLSSSGHKFATQLPETRSALLGKYDMQVFNGERSNTFYKDFKATTAQAYYASEAGASEELAYEPVPGEWVGCADLTDYPKTWAT